MGRGSAAAVRFKVTTLAATPPNRSGTLTAYERRPRAVERPDAGVRRSGRIRLSARRGTLAAGEAVSHATTTRFHEILAELGALHNLKSQDYGTGTDPLANVRASQEWGIPAWIGAMVRLNDKVRRLQSMVRNGRLANESAEDSFRDIAVYAILAFILWEEARDAAPPR